jgi:hypothetical protein
MTVVVNALPAIVTVSGAGTFCVSTTISASGGTGGTIYFQGTTSGGISTATASSSQLISSTGTYYFRAQSAAGCWGPEGSAAVTITTPVTPTVSIAALANPVASGAGASFTATPSLPVLTYQWYKNTLPVGTGTDTYTYTPVVAGDQVYVDMTTSSTCVTSANATSNTITMTINAPAAFNVTGSGSFCSTGTGRAVGLDGSESGVTYTLYKGAVAQIPTVAGTGSAITFGDQTEGTYTVTGTYGAGTTSMTGIAVIAKVLAPEAIAGGTQVGTSGTIIPITGASWANGTITWSTNATEGTFSNIHIINPTYTSPSTPTVDNVTLTLTVSNGLTCPNAVATKTLFLTPSATALTWTGNGISESWTDVDNWDGVQAPGPKTNVTIPSGIANSNYPTLTAAGYCQNITVEWGASLKDNGYLTLSPGAKIIVEHLPISSGQWHYISLPDSGTTSAMFYGNYLYNFNTSTNNYTPILSASAALTAMKGYALWPKNSDFTGAFVGDLNKAPSYSITTSASSGQSWYLIGNPYPSAIDWDLVSKTGIAGAVYIYEGGGTTAPVWSAYVDGEQTGNGSRYIAPTQGFFVKGTGGTFSITNSVRVHAAGSFFKKANETVPNRLRIEVSGNGYKDDAVVRFKSAATAEFDNDFDALKRYGDVTAAAQLYTLGSIPLAINTLPAYNDVPVGIVIGKSGSYTIAATEINGLGNTTLEDTELGIFTDLSAGPYTFDAAAGTFDQRFILHFTMLGLTQTKNVEAAIYSYQRTVHINMKDQVKGDIFIYDISGQQVASKLAAQGTNEIKLTNTGNYIVKVISKNSTTVRKVFILQ